MNTLSVHGGDNRERAHQAIPMPIIQTATYAFADTADRRIARHLAYMIEVQRQHQRVAAKAR